MPQRRPSANSFARRARQGLSLIEILLVAAILMLVAATAVPMFQGGLVDQLENAAQIVLGDVERARQLAVANNSKYKLVFGTSSYYLRHSGTNAAFNTLPSWPYGQSEDSPDRQTTILNELPGLADVDLAGACEVAASTRQPITELEFGPLGSTTRTGTTEVWLAAGKGSARRYISVAVNPVTGLAEVGSILAAMPSLNGAATAEVTGP